MTRRSHAALAGSAIAFALAVAAPSHALLVPLSQERSVGAHGTIHGEVSLTDEDSAAAPDLALFAETAEVALVLGSSRARGTARQLSSVRPRLIMAQGSAEASASEDFGASAFSGAGSWLSLTFEITETTLWHVEASVAGLDDLSIPRAELLFDGPGFENDLELGRESYEWYSGLLELAPGTYTVTALASAGASATEFDNDSTNASFSLRMALIPEPGTAILVGAGLVGLAGRGRAARARR